MRIISVLLCVLALSSCSYDDSRKEISLNGEWNFLATNDVSENEVIGQKYTDWDTLTVPGNWDTRERYKEYVGKGYYQKNFKVPSSWQGKQVRIKFGAVYQTSKVWVNGKLMGEHIGGYTPFEYNITEYVKVGKSNSVVVMADNTYKRGAWWAWGGISRDVNLVCNENVRFVYQHISAIPDFENNKVQFNIKYEIENNSELKQHGTIDSKIAAEGIEILLTKKYSIAGHQTSIIENSYTDDLSKYKLWHFNHPNLYTLQSALKVEDQVQDEINDKFGIRKLEARGEQLFLNNKPVRMNGLNRVHDHPNYGNTEPDHLVQADMSDIKSLGCNFSRLMHAPLAENLLDWCDSMGYMVIEEIPIWGNNDLNSFPNNPQTKQWLNALIERDFNRACVVGWSVGNELRDSVPAWGKKLLTPQQFGYVNSMLDYIDELDTTRLKTYVSLSAYSPTANPTNEPFDKLDLICINSYGNSIKALENTHKNFPSKPIFMSEVGRGQIGPAPNAMFKEDLVEYMSDFINHPYLVGFSYWCYNDYRSNYKGTPESGFREWGIVDEQRNRKKAYDELKEILNKWE